MATISAATHRRSRVFFTVSGATPERSRCLASSRCFPSCLAIGESSIILLTSPLHPY